MLHELRQFLSDPVVWLSLGIAAFFNMITWGVLLLNITPRQDLVILHYTLYFGVDKLGKWPEAFIIPIIGLLLLLVNIFFAYYLVSRVLVASRFFLFLTPVYELIILFSAIFVIIANLPSQI